MAGCHRVVAQGFRTALAITSGGGRIDLPLFRWVLRPRPNANRCRPASARLRPAASTWEGLPLCRLDAAHRQPPPQSCAGGCHPTRQSFEVALWARPRLQAAVEAHRAKGRAWPAAGPRAAKRPGRLSRRLIASSAAPTASPTIRGTGRVARASPPSWPPPCLLGGARFRGLDSITRASDPLGP